MTGGEAALSVLDDVAQLPKGRFAVRVRGHSPRLVPIRERYSDLAREVVKATKASKGPTSSFRAAPTAVFHLAHNLLGDFRSYPGHPGFHLVRARHTWLVAHMLANTPTWAIRALSGACVIPDPPMARRIHQPTAVTRKEAVKLGMGA